MAHLGSQVPRRRPVLLPAAVAAIALLVAACGGSGSSTAAPAAEAGANAHVGSIVLNNVYIDAGISGSAARSDVATVRITLSNQASRPDSLVRVGSDVAARVDMLTYTSCTGTATPVGRLTVPAGQGLAGDASTDQKYFLQLVGLKVGIVVGGIVPITFTFDQAGSVTIPAPVYSGAESTPSCAVLSNA